ncbi:MAG: Smr/MutS family protein [Nitrospira sp.]|nr:Smr/MutS family protein [Nitrospira sp.]
MKKPEPSASPPGDLDFKAAMQDVVPLARGQRVEARRPPPAPIPIQRLRDERQVLVESLASPASPDIGLANGDELVHVRAGVPHTVLRKLRRGHWVIQDEFDLHGMTAEEARLATAAFLQDCVQHGIRCVRIVHGKGLRSKNRMPVLKRKLAHWLIMRDEVLAYCEARPADGGSGAVVVLLRG